MSGKYEAPGVRVGCGIVVNVACFSEVYVGIGVKLMEGKNGNY